MNKKEKIILGLFDREMIKFGEFTLRSGIKSPIYINMREIIGYPEFMDFVAEEYVNKIKDSGVKFDRVTSVAYGALGTGFAVASKLKKPVIVVRKEGAKQHGMGGRVVGPKKDGDTAVIIEDLITKGGSVNDVVDSLREEGLMVNDAFILLDREQGGMENLAKNKVKGYPILTITEMLEVLEKNGKIDSKRKEEVLKFLKK
ncbi:orotate phosphoribosyltransferase [Pseudomonadota bacterium]